MEVSGASTSGSSQPPPDPVGKTPASGPCIGDLAEAADGEGASSIRERIVTGFKTLNKERDLLIVLRAEVKRLRKQRGVLHSSKRASMDDDIHKAKLRVEHQAEVVAALEGQDGPFKEKFVNERRFGRMVKEEVEDEEIPVSDRLPPQSEANTIAPSQGSCGGMLQVIQVAESPARMERMLFSMDDITEDMPDKVKTCKMQIIEKTVFVPFADVTPSNALPIFEDCPRPLSNESLQNDTLADGLQIPAVPVNLPYAVPSAVPGPACISPPECVSVMQQQVTSGTALGEQAPQKNSVDMVKVDSRIKVVNKSPAEVVSGPASSAAGPRSVWGVRNGAPTFAQVVSSAPGSVTKPGQRVQRSSTSGQTLPPQATTSAAPGPSFASLPSTGGRRRNVVILKWEGGVVSPPRRKVVDLILGMGFGANDLYALIHVDGTKDYTVSFTRPEGLDLFWERYEARCRSSPDWEGLAPVAVSVQSTVKKVTIILTNESVPARDLEVWLRHYGEIISPPAKIMDDRDIWTGGWSVTIKLARDGNVVRHLPSSAFIGRDRMTVFYPGQPKLCHRCGEKGHFSSGCSALICTLCRGRGHVAKDCTQIRCNLCHCLGHPYSQCPEAWHNIEKEVREEFDRLERMELFYHKPSAPVADPPGPVQVPSPAATPSVSVCLPSVSVPVPTQPSVSVPLGSQESVSPPRSTPSNVMEDPPSSQEEVRRVGVVEGTKEGAATSSEGRPPGKARAKTKSCEVILSEDDAQYLEGRKGVRRKRRQKTQVAQAEEDPLPVSNRFSVLSGTSASDASSENGEESDMECEGASRKREASGDEQQRGAKKPSI